MVLEASAIGRVEGGVRRRRWEGKEEVVAINKEEVKEREREVRKYKRKKMWGKGKKINRRKFLKE